jgi:hypothetical protein
MKGSVREALTAPSASKDKGPPVSDGVLSITPDSPEVLRWRRDNPVVGTVTSSYLDDEGEGWRRAAAPSAPGAGRGLTRVPWGAAGHKPFELFGKFTWKIENFSEISKRELRSAVFDVGSYKW